MVTKKVKSQLKAHVLHRSASPSKLGFYLVTVSSSRYKKTIAGDETRDESGDIAEKIIRRAKHDLLGRELISDDAKLLKSALRKGSSTAGVDVVLFTGGTGISPTDITIETLVPFFEKVIDGFGELLRNLSFQKIGPSAVLTRATAGVYRRKLIICLPGSPDAVSTALEVFLDEMPHAVYIARGK